LATSSSQPALLVLVEPEDRREHLERAVGVGDEARVDADGERGHRHRQLLTVAIEDRASVRGQRQRARPLLGTGGAQRLAIGGLDATDLDHERGEDDEEDHEQPDQPATWPTDAEPRRSLPGRCSDTASGWPWAAALVLAPTGPAPPQARGT
jgi:hypothetical protein